MNRRFKIIIQILILLILLYTPAFAEEYNFVVLGDSQLENLEVFERIISSAELLQPALVLHVGDMIVGYTESRDKLMEQWKRFKEQIAPLTMPFYPAPGNHDVTTTFTETVYQEIWGPNSLYYGVIYRNTRFIFLDTFLKGSSETITEEQLEWLQGELEQNKNTRHIFITFHSPLHLSGEYDWEPVHALLKQYPVRAVFTGHSHVFDHLERDGIRYFCLNSSGTIPCNNHATGYSYHFLHVAVRGEELSYAVMTDEGIYPPEAVPHREYSRARRYMGKDATIIIPNPSKGAIRQTIALDIENRTDETRDFTVRWITDDYRWTCEPWERRISVKPGTTAAPSFVINGPQGVFMRTQLPKFRVDSPFRNGAGYETTLSHYYALFAPPETTACEVRGDITFDGRLDEAAWREAPFFDTLFIDRADTPAADKTIVKVLYDDTDLYIGIQGVEPTPKGLVARAHGDLPLVFSDDSYEVYLDPGRTLDTFYRIAVNSVGAMLTWGPEGFQTIDCRVGVSVDEDSWSAELSIPFDEIGGKKPSPGDSCGMNIRRIRLQANPTVAEWSRMRGFPAQPEYFGIVRFE